MTTLEELKEGDIIIINTKEEKVKAEVTYPMIDNDSEKTVGLKVLEPKDFYDDIEEGNDPFSYLVQYKKHHVFHFCCVAGCEGEVATFELAKLFTSLENWI